MRAFNRQVKQVSERKQHMRTRVDMRTQIMLLYGYLLEVHAYMSSCRDGDLPEPRLDALLEAGEHLRKEGERWLGGV